MNSCVLADAYGLSALSDTMRDDEVATFYPTLTKLVQSARLRFPADVAHELGILERGAPVAAWAAGLGSHLDDFEADIAFQRPLMAQIQTLGYEAGIRSITGGPEDPAVLAVCRLALDYQKQGVSFVILSTDVVSTPLRPSMSAIAGAFGWQVINAQSCRGNLSF